MVGFLVGGLICVGVGAIVGGIVGAVGVETVGTVEPLVCGVNVGCGFNDGRRVGSPDCIGVVGYVE